VRLAQAQLPANHFVLRTDVKSYYAAIDDVLLMDRLAQFIRDQTILNLCGHISSALPSKLDGFGIPRGGSLGWPLSPLIGAHFLRDFDTRMAKWACSMCVSWTT
jgi:hypothetical protein